MTYVGVRGQSEVNVPLTQDILVFGGLTFFFLIFPTRLHITFMLTSQHCHPNMGITIVTLLNNFNITNSLCVDQSQIHLKVQQLSKLTHLKK